MKNNPYPPSEGWLTATMTLTTKELQPLESIKGFLSGGKPETYEFASIVQTGNKLKAIFRQRPSAG